MRLKKLFALLLVFAFVVTITPIATLAEESTDDSVTSSASNSQNSSAQTSSAGEGGDSGHSDATESTPPTSTDEGTGSGNSGETGATSPEPGEEGTGSGETGGTIPESGEEGNGSGETGVTTPKPGEEGNGSGSTSNPETTVPPAGEETIPEVLQPIPETASLESLLEHLQTAGNMAELWDVLRELSEEEWSLLRDALPQELYEQYQIIAQLEEPITPKPISVIEGSEEEAPVSFTEVAPLLPPVSGPELEPDPMLKTRMTEELAAPTPMMRAFFAPQALVEPLETPEGLELNKSVENADENGVYHITLDAFVTGEFQSETIVTKIPSDIVLVLDESGSMGDPYGKYVGRVEDTVNRTLYTKMYETVYEVKVFQSLYGDYNFYVRAQGASYFYYWGYLPSGTNISADFGLYTNTRIGALREAALNFVGAVKADNAALKDPTNGHRIAVVGFADGSDNITKSLSTSKKTEGLIACTDQTIVTAVNSLQASGATNTQAGMETAADIIKKNSPKAGEVRNQVVILFTDGVPTKHTEFNDDVANGAISAAKSLKAGGASVYTIGIFNGANVTGSSDPNKFMNYVSSNYPNATSMSRGGDRTKEGFYLVASSSTELNHIFDGLSQVIEHGDPAKKGLDEGTVLKDVISPYFQLAETGKIEVFTAACTGKDEEGNYLFDAEERYSSATISLEGKAIHVSGFNYSDNFVGVKPDNETYVGKKLIVKIPVKPIDNFYGGNGVPTNTVDSGLYKNGQPQGKFPVPLAKVPLRYAFTAKDQTIYLSGSADVNKMIDWATASQPDGINNAFVNLNFTVKQGGEEQYSGTIPAGTSGFADLNGTILPRDCTGYTIACEVVPTEFEATNPPIQVGPQASTIHVLKPTIHTQDAWSDYNQTVELKECVVLAQESDANGNVTWSDFTEGHASIPAPTAQKPILQAEDFTFTHMEDGQIVGTSNTYQPTTEANFQLSAMKLGSETYTNTETSKYFAFGSNENSTAPDKLNHAHLTIHMNRFDLVLSKQLDGDTNLYPQSFLFHVKYGEETYPLSFGSRGGTKTIQGLIYGKGTEVSATEEQDWSWRYRGEGTSTVTISSNAVSYGKDPSPQKSYSISITNKLLKKKWLGGTDYKQNQYVATTTK